MPTTTYTDAVFGVRNIGARTTSAGAAATDLSAEEDRYSQAVLSPGILKPSDGFLAASGGGWDVDFGSGAVKADYAVVEGVNSGQGNYLARLSGATEAVTLDPADGSNPRIDEVYLIVADAAYDGGSVALPRFGYRKGDAAASPSAPGPDAAWDAYLLLASVSLPAGAATIDACTINDERVASNVTLGDGTEFGRVDDDAIVNVPTGGTVRIQVNDTDILEVSASGVDTLGNDLTVGAGLVDGVDVSAHGSRHNPGGSDAITTGTPGSITPDASASAGTASSVARSDHRHAIATAAPSGSLTPDEANSEGTSSSFSRADHQHNVPAGTPSAIGTANAEGSSTSFARRDHIHRVTDAAAVAVTGGQSDKSTTVSTTATYATYTSAAFTMPSGWSTALIIAWGNAYFDGIHVSNDAHLKILIDASSGTDNNTTVGASETVLFASHQTTVSGSCTVALQSKADSQDNGGANVEAGGIAFIAIRAS